MTKRRHSWKYGKGQPWSRLCTVCGARQRYGRQRSRYAPSGYRDVLRTKMPDGRRFIGNEPCPGDGRTPRRSKKRKTTPKEIPAQTIEDLRGALMLHYGERIFRASEVATALEGFTRTLIRLAGARMRGQIEDRAAMAEIDAWIAREPSGLISLVRQKIDLGAIVRALHDVSMSIIGDESDQLLN